MTIIKYSSSKKAVQVITDDGDVFMTSVAYLQSFLAGTLKKEFIMMKKMPFGVNPDRFPKSEVWIPPNMDKEYIQKQQERADKNSTDAFSKNYKKEQEDKKKYMSDDNVW